MDFTPYTNDDRMKSDTERCAEQKTFMKIDEAFLADDLAALRAPGDDPAGLPNGVAAADDQREPGVRHRSQPVAVPPLVAGNLRRPDLPVMPDFHP